MKNGKIILSAAALAVTALSSFSFRANRWTLSQLHTSASNCHAVGCYTIPTGTSNPNPCASGTYYTAAASCSGTAWSGLKTTQGL